MKSALTLFACSLFAATAPGQQYPGYAYDNYAGTQSLLLNPAHVAGSKYKVDVNLVSVSFLAGNNAYELDKNKMFRLDFSDLREGTHYFKSANTANKKLWVNSDIMGPSFMVTTGPKSGFGIITRMRTIANEYNLSNNTFQFFNSDGGLFDTDIREEQVQLKMHAFAEAGLTYGRVIYQSPTRLLKLGVTGKYIAGVGVGSFHSNNLLLNVNPSKDFNNFSGDATLQYSSNIDALQDGNFSDVFDGADGKGGWGLDVGLVYEWRPINKKRPTTKNWWLHSDPTPYKLRMSVSVTDVGMVKYKNSPHGNSYLINAAGYNTDEFEKPENEDFDDYFSRLETSGILNPHAWEENLKVKLPMAIRADIDWHVYKRIFINAGAVVNMLSRKKNALSAHYTTSFTVTPRLEKKWFSIYTPVYYNLEEQFSWGAGVRIGPLFAGSASVLSNLIGEKNISAMDFHVGVHIPVFQVSKASKKQVVEKPVEVVREVPVDNDKDDDGVTDDKDECPDVPGEIVLIGCPDKDGDGVADHKDKCPDSTGVEKYNGCPVPDTDGDGVNDDLDKCPNLRGPVAHDGCPEVKKEVVKKVNTVARRIFFVSGKSMIQKISYEQLNVIVSILKADPNLRLTIDGHTDNVGSAATNDALSARRAQAVKNYLMSKGIPAHRMKVQGFGSARPIADNKTIGGRARNRRVEMHLGYESK